MTLIEDIQYQHLQLPYISPLSDLWHLENKFQYKSFEPSVNVDS